MPTKLKHHHLQRDFNYSSHRPGLHEAAEEISQAEISPDRLRQATLNPKGASPSAILGLQSRYGNQAVGRL